jgi:hypothetical protein
MAIRLIGSVSNVITRATISPNQPLGRRDWRAMNSEPVKESIDADELA